MTIPIAKTRAAETSDAREWSRLRDTLRPHHDPAEHTREVRDFFKGSSTLAAVFVAAHQDQFLVGFIEVSLRQYADGCRSSPVPYIEGWFVEERARRNGVARALVEAAEAWARDRGYDEMASDCHAENTVSRRAHAALGFDEVEVAVHLRKTLK